MAVIPVPLVLVKAASKPTAVLLEVVFEYNALYPTDILLEPETLLYNASLPIPMLKSAFVLNNDSRPIATLKLPVLF